jgi:RHS repeat-associated protein
MQVASATASTGTITVSGSEQSKAITTTQGTQATGSISIKGSESTYAVCVTHITTITCTSYPDTGAITVTVGGFQTSVYYSSGTTDANLVYALATNLNSSSSPVTATASGSTLTLTSKVVGVAGDYSFTVSGSATEDPFSETVSGSALSGGINSTVTSVYDSGTVTATINGVQAVVSYGQSASPSSLAQSIAAAINSASGGVLTANPDGASVSVASVQTGSGTDWPISLSVTYNSGEFSAASFSVTSSGLSGGSNAATGNATVYSFTVNPAPDGQITSSNDSVNGNWTYYGYDEFNRLTSAVNGTTQSQFTWDYDRYGNRWHQNLLAGSGGTTTLTFADTSNRASTVLSYDAAGNVLYDGVQHNFTYDAENRLVGVNAGIGYIYDAEGRRVGKTNGTVYTVGTSGQVLDEVDGTAWTRSEVYVGSKHLATVTSAGVFFIHSDWLGTERMRTAASGLSCETISSNPFGDNVQQSGNCNVSPDFFTGKPRDTESNLDDFGARYFSSQWGRWMSADWTAAPSSVPYATLTNPQSLNLYAYVGNDPVDGQDADGHARYDKSGSGCGIYLSYCAADGFGDGGDTLWQQQEIEGDDCEAFVQAQLLNAGNGNASSDETTPASGSTAQWYTAQQQSSTDLNARAQAQYNNDVPIIAKQLGVSKDEVLDSVHIKQDNDGNDVVVGGHVNMYVDSGSDAQSALMAKLGPKRYNEDPATGEGRGSEFSRLGGMTPSVHLDQIKGQGPGLLHVDRFNAGAWGGLGVVPHFFYDVLYGGSKGNVALLPY